MKTKLFLFALCVFVSTQAQNMHNGHEYVDLGFPSGTLWATCNVGANSPEEYGWYFAWGESSAKHYFPILNYSKPPTADAAHVNWGGYWRIPTSAELSELSAYCKWEWTTLNNVQGQKGTSKFNGNSIFLPFAGKYLGDKFSGAGSYGIYWSSTCCTPRVSAIILSVEIDDVGHAYSSHLSQGNSVRPVCCKSVKTEAKNSQTKSHVPQSQNKPKTQPKPKKPALTK